MIDLILHINYKVFKSKKLTGLSRPKHINFSLKSIILFLQPNNWNYVSFKRQDIAPSQPWNILHLDVLSACFVGLKQLIPNPYFRMLLNMFASLVFWKKSKYILHNKNFSINTPECHGFWKGLAALTEFYCFRYCGHGNGTQYFSSDMIFSLDVKAIPLLFGCSSVKMEDFGGRVCISGLAMKYLTAGR